MADSFDRSKSKTVKSKVYVRKQVVTYIVDVSDYTRRKVNSMRTSGTETKLQLA